MANIFERLDTHYRKCCEIYGEGKVLGVFLYGSQNYKCDTPESDIDTKAIIVPNLYDLAIHPIKTVERSIDGEHCECHSIQHIVENWKKQNINFVEILYTDYKIINPKYSNEWDNLVLYRDRIARYNMNQTIQSICGQAIHTIKQNPRDGKKIGNGIRLKDFLSKYINARPYSECIIPNQATRDRILECKKNLVGIANLELTAENLLEYFYKVREEKFAVDQRGMEFIDSILNKFILDSIILNIY